MEHKIDMRGYLFEQLILLSISWASIIGIYILTNTIIIYMICLEAFVILIYTLWLWRILLYPLDLITGTIELDAYPAQMNGISRYEIFTNRYSTEWRFLYGSNGKLTVLVPVCMSMKEITSMEAPKQRQKVRIKYYRYSKLLYSWKVL